LLPGSGRGRGEEANYQDIPKAVVTPEGKGRKGKLSKVLVKESVKK
jgi:hypothetical protein